LHFRRFSDPQPEDNWGKVKQGSFIMFFMKTTSKTILLQRDCEYYMCGPNDDVSVVKMLGRSWCRKRKHLLDLISGG